MPVIASVSHWPSTHSWRQNSMSLVSGKVVHIGLVSGKNQQHKNLGKLRNQFYKLCEPYVKTGVSFFFFLTNVYFLKIPLSCNITRSIVVNAVSLCQGLDRNEFIAGRSPFLKTDKHVQFQRDSIPRRQRLILPSSTERPNILSLPSLKT